VTQVVLVLESLDVASKKHRGVKLLTLPDGRNVARYKDPLTGRQKQESLDLLGLTSIKAREQWAIAKLKLIKATRLEQSLTTGGLLPVKVTIEQSVGDFLGRHANQNTRVNQTSAMNNVAMFLTKKGVKHTLNITVAHIAEYRDHVKRPGSPYAATTRALHLVITAAWLKWCIDRGSLTMAKHEDIKRLLKRDKLASDAIVILQPKELRQLLASCIEHDKNESVKVAPLVLTTLLTGCRFGEAAGLTWAEIDVEDKSIKLDSARTKTKTHRTIKLTETPSVPALFAALGLSGRKGKVFKHITRSAAESARKRLANYDAPPGWTWHTLRRTCGSLCVNAAIYGKASPFRTAKRLGHSLAVAERSYLGTITGLPKNCETIEEAAGIQTLADAIVRSVAINNTKSRRAQ
jgi:integrase